MKKSWIAAVVAAALTAAGLSQADAQDIKIRIGFPDPLTTPWAQSLAEFKKIVETDSKGRISVQLFPSEQLGSIVEMIQNVRQGAQEMSLASPAWFGQFYSKIDMLELPFLVTNWDEARKLLASKPYRDLLAAAEKETGIRVYATFPFGFRNIANSKRPINTLDDLKGMKLRVINSPVQLASWRALGASPVGLAWGETYQAVQTGVLDGLENTPGVLAANKYPEIAKYISESRHMFGIMLAYINLKFYNGLSAGDRAILDKAMKAAEEFNYKNVVALEEKSDKELRAMNAVVNKVPAETIAKMQAAIQPVYESLAGRFEPELSALRKAVKE